MKKNILTLLIGSLAAAAATTSFAAPPVRLDSYSVEKRALREAVESVDADGARRPFNQVYVVRLKGVIPTTQAHPVKLFIGDMPVQEYGATKDGVYFHIYDPKQLRNLHGKAFRFATHGKGPQQSALVFNAPAE
jgi:hypothetical protein